jgi:pyruvate dehydrogenase E2 component (dihydrolipoamide acetyltransferase)
MCSKRFAEQWGATMATEVKLPRLGQGMESGTIVKWLKSEGDKVEKGEALYELDTDKVTQEVEAEASGVLLKIAISEGEVEVGRTIAVIGEQGEKVDTEPEKPAGNGSAAQEVADDAQEEGSPAGAREHERERGRRASAGDMGDQLSESRQPSGDNGGRIKASPLARRIARERGIDLSAVAGTGPDGRVVAEDVERTAASGAPVSGPAVGASALPLEGVEVQELSSMRKTIARRLTEAWQAPVFQLSVTVDMGRALELRKRLVELQDDGAVKPTISDLLTKVSAAALMRHRAVNALYKGDAVELYPTANIGIAVAVPNGLVVPVIQGCERKSIAEIAAARALVVERARGGKLQQADLDGGTFTISNLGMYGIERFIAVLNPPQAAILAVGSTEDKVVAVDGQPAVRPRMEITLTCDHRAVDGATGAEFLRDLKAFLEEPGLAL